MTQSKILGSIISLAVALPLEINGPQDKVIVEFSSLHNAILLSETCVDKCGKGNLKCFPNHPKKHITNYAQTFCSSETFNCFITA